MTGQWLSHIDVDMFGGKVHIIPNSMLNGSQKWDTMKEFVIK
ncbi:MAG: hypothetical protein QXH93_04820 [Conexivisphaerales archaeon]